MTHDDDWHQTALDKLTRVLGPSAGASVMAEVLASVGLVRLETALDLRHFSEALALRGGFAGAVGGLLSVHAAMHGASPARRDSA